MQFIQGPARLQMQVNRNFDEIMNHKLNRIEEQSMALKTYYNDNFKKFDSAD